MSGPANLVTNASKLNVPVLWISGTTDAGQLSQHDGFGHVPANPMNRYLQVDGNDPFGTAQLATRPLIAWLKELAQVP